MEDDNVETKSANEDSEGGVRMDRENETCSETESGRRSFVLVQESGDEESPRGVPMDLSGHRLLVTTIDTETNQELVVSVPLSTKEDDDDDDDNYNDTATSSLSSSSMNMPQSQLVLTYSDHTKQPGAIATDSHGNMFLATETGTLIVSKSKEINIKLEIPHVIR
ncbi:hypothetical protein IV203_025494 [Nitzschia inconspicua]|uniref:Uncharacterized protein n=1 Tax=Nitzschia inconspicua TaxID=303405 RepID=A0A9K3LIZ5_9STRA|nr:hypothetical protein IV203_028271 [Nitzschia inconspicua]KAG7362610.1 hypothetical protein IV203_025494 [Nitzschia inconspicua]